MFNGAFNIYLGVSKSSEGSRVRCPKNDGKIVVDLVGFVPRLFHSRLKGFLCSANLQILLFQTRYP